MSEEQIPMYCCSLFSYAVYFKLITIDTDCNHVKISLQTSLSDNAKEIKDRLEEERITHIDPDALYIIRCPWCGTHLKHVIDFDKAVTAGKYSSKEGWER